MKTGLFFGSFNPVHIGHLIVADAMVRQSDLEEVWFVISPQSPFKKKSDLADEHHRLAMVQLATDPYAHLLASDVEFGLQRPSYTIDTLEFMKKQHPAREFKVVLGSDNLDAFDQWKRYEDILEKFELYIYLRPGSTDAAFLEHSSVRSLPNVPLLDISSTYIRNRLIHGIPIDFLCLLEVIQYIEHNRLYTFDVHNT